jgi:pimeloyl-ACP methyl ester carboxylesterase
VLDAVPELKAVLPPTAIGKDYPYEGDWFGLTASRTGAYVSLGGLRIAARGHEHLVAVILVASFTSQPVAWMPSFARYVVHPSIFRLPGQVLLMRWLLFGRSPPAALIKGTIDSLRSVDPAVLAGRTKAALTVDATAAFMRCPVPMLYLGATQDRLISPQTAERLKALRPDLECVMLDAPHFLLQRAPAAAAQALTEFLLRLNVVRDGWPIAPRTQALDFTYLVGTILWVAERVGANPSPVVNSLKSRKF